MVKVNVSTKELPIAASDYFVQKDSAAFRALLCQALNFTDMNFGRTWADESGLDAEWVELHTRPDVQACVPKSLQGCVKDLVFVDELCYEREKVAGPTYQIGVVSKLFFLKDSQYNIRLTMHIEPIGEQRCRQRLQGSVDIKVFGIGGMIQSIVLQSIRNAYAVLPEVVERWVQFRDKTMVTEEGRAALLQGCPAISTIPQEALDVMKRPYHEVAPTAAAEEEEEEQEQDQEAPKRQAPKLTGAMRTETSLYFDANEFLAFDDKDMDEDTRTAVLGDKLVLMELAQAGELEELELVEGGGGGVAAAEGKAGHKLTPSGSSSKKSGGGGLLPASLSEGQEQRQRWARFWQEAGIAKPKMANPGGRLKELLGSMDKLGMLKVSRSNTPSKRLPSSDTAALASPLSRADSDSLSVESSSGSIANRAASEIKGALAGTRSAIVGGAKSFTGSFTKALALGSGKKKGKEGGGGKEEEEDKGNPAGGDCTIGVNGTAGGAHAAN